MADDVGGGWWWRRWHWHWCNYLTVFDDDKIYSHRNVTYLHNEHVIDLIVVRLASLYIDANGGGRHDVYGEDGGRFIVDPTDRS